MYRTITMYQIVCDRCGNVFEGTDTHSALFADKCSDIANITAIAVIVLQVEFVILGLHSE